MLAPFLPSFLAMLCDVEIFRWGPIGALDVLDNVLGQVLVRDLVRSSKSSFSLYLHDVVRQVLAYTHVCVKLTAR